MSATTPIAESLCSPLRERSAAAPIAYLHGLGTAVPELVRTQRDVERELADLWQLRGKELDRWQRICRGAAIEKRHGVLPISTVIPLTTAQRMERFESFAPPLAAQAAHRAIDGAGIGAASITDLIIVSCTGFASPGLDIELVRRLGLRNTVRRTMIGFMGCFGAINGLRAAVGACAADPSAAALVVCCELCSLHVRDDRSPDNLVASALFSDGAAAAVVSGASYASSHICEARAGNGASVPKQPLGRLSLGSTRLIRGTEHMMSWRITDAGFAMTLARDVPIELRKAIAGFVSDEAGIMPRAIVPHPGGPGVLDAIAAALPDHFSAGIGAGLTILRECGNMSSGTVLFVLERMLHTGIDLPATLLAFGPGLTMESITLRASSAE